MADSGVTVGDFGRMAGDLGRIAGDFGRMAGDFGRMAGDFGRIADAPRVLPKEIRRKGADCRCCPLPRSFGLASPFVCCRCWRVLASVLVVVVGRRVHHNREERSPWKRYYCPYRRLSIRTEVVRAGDSNSRAEIQRI